MAMIQQKKDPTVTSVLDPVDMKVTIKENSLIARFAAFYMKAGSLALVIGRTVHLHGAGKAEFLSNRRWVCHEIVHLHQCRAYGPGKFLFLYLLESWRKGYVNNRFEVEARQREGDQALLSGVYFT